MTALRWSSFRSLILLFASITLALMLSGRDAPHVLAAPPNDDVADWAFGTPTGFTTALCNNGGSASQLYQCDPGGIAWDPAGNLWVADSGNGRVLQYDSPLTLDLVPDRVFGKPNFTTGQPAGGPANCAAPNASDLCYPGGVALDAAGNLYVADTGNHRVLRFNAPLTTDGVADAVYGQPGFVTDTCNNGGITASSLCSPDDVAFDGAGNLFVSDFTNDRLLAYSPGDAVADRVFGQPNFTTAGANTGGRSASSLHNPNSITVDAAGRLWVADYDNLRVLGYNNPMTSDSVADYLFGQPNYTGVTFTLSQSTLALTADVAFSDTGTMYVADWGRNAVVMYEQAITTDGIADGLIGTASYTTFTCNQGGLSAASTCGPRNVAVGPGGTTLALSDSNNNRTLLYFPPDASDKTADRVLGQSDAWSGSICNAGGRSASSLCSPSGVAIDSTGNVYIADTLNHRVLGYQTPLTTDMVADMVFGQGGNFSTASTVFPPNANSLAFPYGVAVDNTGNLYVADTGNARVLRFNTPFASDTVPDQVFGQGGSFTTGSCNLGGRSSSSLCDPTGLYVDAAGNLYVSDYSNDRVLQFNTPLSSDTVADRVFGKAGFANGGCNAGGLNASSLCGPYGIALDTNGSMFVADRNNSRVLRYDNPLSSDAVADGLIGQADFTTQDCNNFVPVDIDAICWPIGVAADSAQVYIGDEFNNRVLRGTAIGTPVQVFGQLGSFTSNNANQGGMSARTLDRVLLLATDSAGRLYAADADNSRVLVFNTGPDTDTDLVLNASDNCATVANPSQTNSDGNFIDNPPSLTQDDTSRAMSDGFGDACDLDADNDGLKDTIEAALPGAACPAATTVLSATNPDTDGDGSLDGAECTVGTNPSLASSKPTGEQCRILAGAAAQATDTDGDLLQDRIEACGYATGRVVLDSDGDGRRDGCEVASLNTLPAVNSLDQLLLAQAIIADLAGPFVWNADLNKDGANNSADQLLMAQILIGGEC